MLLLLTSLWILQGCEAPGELSTSTDTPISGKADINNVQDLDLNSLEWVRILNHNNIPSKILVMLNSASSQITFVEDLSKILAEINRATQGDVAQPMKVVLVGATPELASTLKIEDEFKNQLLEVVSLNVGGNMWLQDFGEIMAAKTVADDQEQLLLFDSNRGRGLRDLAATLADLWNGYYYKIPEASLGGNDGGDIEVTPNNILYLGSKSTNALRQFFAQYGYHDQMLILDTEWLRVGHVDEFVSTILLKDDPCGFGLVKADPTLALDLLKNASAEDVQELLALPYKEEQNDFSIMKVMQKYLQTGKDTSFGIFPQIVDIQLSATQVIDENVTKMKEKISEVSPQCRSIKEISFPVLYINGIAVLPNPVNMTVLWDHQIISDPLFKPYREYIESALKSLNQTPHFINDLEYHQRLGEVHCGTNVVRLPDKYFIQ